MTFGMYDVRCKRADGCRLSSFYEHELNEFDEFMEGKPKRVRFRKDGKLDIEFETEDGRTEIAEGCTLHIDTDPNSGDEFPVTFTVHKGEQYLIKDTNGDRQHLQHGLPGGDEADSRRND